MDGLFRRGGVWWARLVVPSRLRESAGRREFIRSTGTHDKTIGKLVASVLMTDWRRQIIRLQGVQLDDEKILRLVDGIPSLAAGGYVSLERAAELLGFEQSDLLRAGAAGKLSFHWTVVQDSSVGNLVPLDALELNDPAAGRSGGVVVPAPDAMPPGAQYSSMLGQTLLISDSCIVATQVLGDGLTTLELLAFDAPSRPGWIFIPEIKPTIEAGRILLPAIEVEALRTAAVASVSSGRIERARTSRPERLGRKADKRLSDAIAEFAHEELRQTCGNPKERERIQTGIGLLIEFMGDLRLHEIDADLLRRFRDEHLSTVPARLNHAESRFGTTGVKDTIDAIERSGAQWPIMSAAERDQRMTWICRMFRWLKGDWLNEDPSEPLRGVSVLAKDEQKLELQKSITKKRQRFTPEELTLIFSQSWFHTGNGQIAEARAMNRKWCSYEYWLPLMCLHAGQRIRELSQLHLGDIRQTKNGVWYLDINENTCDKSLKNGESARVVPLHQELIDAGFVAWCDRLRQEGFQRLFPDLAWSPVTGYAKESIRSMSMMLADLGMPRDNTKVFHSLRHTTNNALIRHSLDGSVPDMIRLRLLGHAGGKGENITSYFDDFVADESAKFVNILNFNLPKIASFDIDEGIKSIRSALERKHGRRKGREDMGPLTAGMP